MATIFDVASYILSKQGPMTTMKLEKLCYYAQAWSLVWDEDAIRRGVPGMGEWSRLPGPLP